jgi:hypothetical protein
MNSLSNQPSKETIHKKEHHKIHKTKLDLLITNEPNPYLNEMKYRLETYKAELEESIKSNKKIEHESFKKNFFASLENLVHQVIYIKDKKLREEKIDSIYKWYDSKSSFFRSLNPIDVRTDKNFYENFPSVDKHIKSDYYEAQNYPLDFEKEHRTEEGGLLPPRDR